MSQRKVASIENLLAAKSPTSRPSLELAKMVLKPLLEKIGSDVPDFDIMEHDSHPDYCPTFAEIVDWAHCSMSQANLSGETIGTDYQYEVNDFTPALDDFAAGHISLEELIEEVAKNYAFIDNDAVFGGTAAMRQWHAARILREARSIFNFKAETVDATYGVPLAKVADIGRQLERLQAGQDTEANHLHANDRLDSAVENLRELLNRTPQIIEAALRMGFLYRDAWWIENHGEVTIKGYLSQMRSTKAGESGGRQSNKKRMTRIKYFLECHAKLISENQILRTDPPEDVAHRALKLAAQKHPESFKTGCSKRTAIDYWEYIRSDQELLAEYENFLRAMAYRNIA